MVIDIEGSAMEDKKQLIEDLLEEFKRKETPTLENALDTLKSDVLAAFEHVLEKGASPGAALTVMLDLVSQEIPRSVQFAADRAANTVAPGCCDRG
jgi:hypothetical protein